MTQYMVLNKKYSKITVLLLLLLLMAAGNAMAQVVVGGSVYGGGKLADVKGNTEVKMAGGSVAENVFGGGKGKADTFTCEKAMVGVEDGGVTIDTDEYGNETYTLLPGGTTVNITGGTVNGNVYGGGEVGRVERNTQVTIGDTGETGTPIIEGNVFGAGAGVETHGYSALVRGTSTVTIQGKAEVKKNVYGGGEMASVGRYWIATPANVADEAFHAAHPNIKVGMPYGLKSGGKSTVVIQGQADIGTDGNTNFGHVYGAGQGFEPRDYDYITAETYTGEEPYKIEDHKPWRMYRNYLNEEKTEWEDLIQYFDSRADYLQFIETLAVSAETDLTIGGGTVKGSVFGGSESGFVYRDTKVMIQNGTINGSAFGGGRGLESFAEAGRVGGNTKLTMSAGTVMGNVYGGGNLGEVGTINKTDINNYRWTNQTAEPYDYNDTGVCTVTINGASAQINGNVFGASKGSGITYECEKAMVYKTNVSIINGTVNVSVYGGGEIGRVETDTEVKIGYGTGEGPFAPTIGGDVFGAGEGLETHGYSALVRGNPKVSIAGNAQVGNNAYGGGKIATVGRYWVKTNPAMPGAPPAPEDLDYDMPYQQRSGGKCTVLVEGHATIGTSGTGHVFGAGKGVEPSFSSGTSKKMTSNGYVFFSGSTAEADYLLFLQTLALVTNTYVTINGTATVNGNVYGGSENGFVQHDTSVEVINGEIGTTDSYGNVFGGGLGYSGFNEAGQVKGNTTIDIRGGTTHGNVYGGGELGDVKGTTEIKIYAIKYENEESISYEARSKGSEDVTVVGDVFGGGKGKADNFTCDKAMVGVDGDGIANPDGGTTIVIGNGVINGNVYGGGEVGRVEKNTVVTIGIGAGGNDTSAPYIKGDVFGAGAGVNTHGFSALVRGNSTVTIQGDAKVGKSVYGGGEIASIGRYVVINSLPTKPAGGGKCTVNVKGHATIGEISEGDVFGAGKGVVPYEGVTTGTPWSMKNDGTHVEYTESNKDAYFTFIQTLALANDTEVTIDGDAKVKGSVYGGSESGFVQRYTQVTIQGNSEIGILNGTTDVDGDVYGSGRGNNSVAGYAEAGKVKGNTTVNISGGIMHGSVYGGGELGLVIGSVDVNVTGGTVNHDVFGGGALADTNTGNGTVCVQVPGISTGDDVTGLYENKYIPTQDQKAVANKTYYELSGSDYVAVTGLIADESTVSGYYEWSESTYDVTSDGTAVAGKIYYTKTHPTTVELTGGLIKGDAYGGGLGRLSAAAVTYTQEEADAYNTEHGLSSEDEGFVSEGDVKVAAVGAVPAVVYGDINISLGGTAAAASSSATAFNITSYDGGHADVVKSGRVFGCNNLNGSPQGNVTVTVWKTVTGTGESGKTSADKIDSETETDHHYEVASVYGGGNLAPFTTTGKKTHVIIHGCSDTSIETVYGGGNAAAVPETDVDIYSCYEIGSVFGGGNGKDEYTLDGGSSWNTNPGANVGFKDEENPPVGGDVNTMIYGGTVHEAFGGSNKKGTIYGNVSIDVGSAEDNFDRCTLNVGKIVGAGKEADIEGDLKIIMGCKPNDKIGLVFGGADNANVNGNVELTVTSGNFGKVFGGNNLGGIIKGHIKLNIEETGKCAIPIKIDELYLGGNEAMYSMYGYYKAGNTYIARTAEMAKLNPGDEGYIAAEEGIHQVPYDAPELNIISCTRIGKVFGGGLGAPAAMYANPIVNINMIPGDSSFKIDRNDTDGADNDYHALGEIVDVYGGGNQAKVYGNTTVNIGTATEVTMTSVNDLAQAQEFANGTSAYSRYKVKEDDTNIYGIVEGAFITGNVYGGGKLADVTGNTYVNVCAEQVAVLDVNSQPTGEYTYNIVNITGTNYEGVTIGGNVYGGGEGYAKMEEGTAGEAFLCAKAMIGVDGEGIEDKDNNGVADHPEGGTSVVIGNGTVTGNVYGGGQVGRVEKNTKVTIGIGDGGGGENPSAPVIQGNVFGAGAGVSTHGYSALVRGTSTVLVEGDAKVLGSVYGGGEKASVGRYIVGNDGLPQALNNALAPTSGYCYVTIRGYAEIGPDDMKMYHTDANGDLIENNAPDDAGHVFGACQGVMPYQDLADNVKPKHMDGIRQNDESWVDHLKEYTAYSSLGADEEDANYSKFIKSLALATQTLVTIEGNPFIKGSVYGGSENGYVQQDTRVVISSGQIGNGYVQMNDNGVYLNKQESPETPMSVNRRFTTAEWAAGHLIPDQTKEPDLYALVHEKYYTSSLPECASWPYGQAANAADRYASYDREANKTGNLGQYANGNTTEGGRYVGDDGHTFYGNVFGGGSGYYPYRPGKWFKDAGAVYGNTYVIIKGGHILTNVYGGNEMTDVGKYADDDYLNLTSGGTCYVTMIGGTLGVPRTLKQIDAHPVTCYLFGAGKGDQRVFFNKSTNIGNAVIHVSDDARIYGSIFGGGEDGHVMKNVTMNIGGNTLPTEVSGNSSLTSVFDGVSLSGSKTVDEVNYPYIGTWGTSYVEGNVFGGGRGFGGDAYTAGNVSGSVTMNIFGGTMLGSIYGGGRLGSVGYGLYLVNEEGYGLLRKDDKMDDDTDGSSYFTNGRGHVTINISGGTIGNEYEYIVPTSTNIEAAGIYETDISKWTAEGEWKTWKTYYHVPNTEYDTDGKLLHTKGGNVFAGGMGRREDLNGNPIVYDSSNPSSINWHKLGNVKQTNITVSDAAWIKSNVYGGGEFGAVRSYYEGPLSRPTYTQGGNTVVNITGGTIGTLMGPSVATGGTKDLTLLSKMGNADHDKCYTFGSVYGGGYGTEKDITEANKYTRDMELYAALIIGNTSVTMTDGTVLGSVYGGGEVACVGGNSTVEVKGTSKVGVNEVRKDTEKKDYVLFGSWRMGNVYGGGRGSEKAHMAGLIMGNATVNIGGTAGIYHNVYGGGAIGSVGLFTLAADDFSANATVLGGTPVTRLSGGLATVTITGTPTIGINGWDNGIVSGSSRGDVTKPVVPTGAPEGFIKTFDIYDRLGWVNETNVTIGTVGDKTAGPTINGSVYGGGENGHNLGNSQVTVNSGTIGYAGYDSTKDDYECGNVYGAGCGTDTYTDGEVKKNNPIAGIVRGTTTVNITGGTVRHNVYGAGSMASVGTTDNTGAIVSGGTTAVTVSGGIVGVDGNNKGNVFGAARGNATSTQTGLSKVKTTNVTVSNGTVKGNVYGGGESGDVQENTTVAVQGGIIDKNVFGGGLGVEGNEAAGMVKGNTTLDIYGGTINGSVYGGGALSKVVGSTNVNIGRPATE